MFFTSEAIPEGSFLLRGFLGGADAANSEDIDLVVNLMNLGGGVCEVAAAIGDMTTDGNIALGLKAHELGFRILQFHALKGTKVTRWAEKVSSDDAFDYYRVDLPAAIAWYAASHATEKAL